MKQAIQKGQITVPPRPRTNAQIKPVVDALVTSVQQLRDRRVFYNQSPRGGSSGADHPFRATANGDDTVTIAPGLLITYRDNANGDLSENDSVSTTFIESASGTITATDAEGYAYLLCDLKHVLTSLDTLPSSVTLRSERQAYDGTPAIIYSTTAPASFNPQSHSTPRNFAIPIAKITLADDIASVVAQYVKTDIFPIGGTVTYEPTP